MTDLKSRWAALWDNTPADDTAKSTPAQVSTSTTESAPNDSVPAQATTDVPAVVPDNVDNLPIYEAPAAMIDYWHAFGCHLFLNMLLRQYALDCAQNGSAHNHFKIGLNEIRHEATFAIDYAAGKTVRYYAIPFNEKNTAPIDKNQARRVLEKVSQLREARRRFEKFGEFMIEQFDEAK